MTNRQAASVEDAFERALGSILARVSVFKGRIAVAYSGGLDSAVLLHLAQRYTAALGLELFAFHVHHGLSPNADSWLAHCEAQCAATGIRFDAQRVVLQAAQRDGIEQAARAGRYAALGELCRRYDAALLLTAHHQDDQAETVLLQLLRGAGLPGLSGMAVVGEAHALLGAPLPVLARPLLEVWRAELEVFASRHGIRYVEDESNDDVRYARNALRHKVMPVLEAGFPGYQERVARTARHAQSAQQLLDEIAALDWQTCGTDDRIDMRRFQTLSEARQDNLLRHWFTLHRMRMPSTAWLAEMRAQLLNAREDAQVCVIHPDCEVHRHRGQAFLVPRMPATDSHDAGQSFRWQGEPHIAFAELGGTLHFDPAQEGIAAAWLVQQRLEIRRRQGGEKLKLAPGRPTRSLKQHYQSLDIPAWERPHLPVVFAGGRLIYAAGIGINRGGLPEQQGEQVRLRWERDNI
ncbi:tRNA lysidine(34) synthetase TilS [Noviherbaspirillum sp.]|uniref:tRNA lysidine(34) synthetase TilS n=1 Tax=Noviherbaspirillum sp. TaxID=1926288 RepID=UPI002D538FD2|nr:tRNA lysidine(34) synthetase TilS [Noviherbaspirillum sp.]HZW23241.1 tRNA lysidine(34) synthetase TilS [Noviherbaspirillum sp.]